MPLDPADLTARLIRCPSVTPDEGGALVLLQAELEAAGFDCTRVDRNGTANLFARWGAKGANRSFGFNGHTDVVPPGDAADWRFPPFSGTMSEGRIWGRGACDMKGGLAASVIFYMPIFRQIVTWIGGEDASRKNAEKLLGEKRRTVGMAGSSKKPKLLGIF